VRPGTASYNALHRIRRRSVRVPVSQEVSCECAHGELRKGKAINLGSGGVCTLLAASEHFDVNARIQIEFLLPHTLNSVRTGARIAWRSLISEGQGRAQDSQATGVEFRDLPVDYQSLLHEYVLTRFISTESLLKGRGIVEVMNHIRNLRPSERLRYYHLLIRRTTFLACR